MCRRAVDQVKPRNGNVLQVGILTRISGCPGQKELSLDDQIAHGKDVAGALYQGRKRYLNIRSKGKGERLDRKELRMIRKVLRSNRLDLLVMEDLGRLVRGVTAVDILGLAVDHGTRVIAPNDDIDTNDGSWEEAAIAACRDHVGHNAHTSKRIKQKLRNRFRSFGGATARPIYGYIVPKKTSPDQTITYSDWKIDPTATTWIQQGAQMLLDTLNASVVADWLTENKVPDGPYTRRKGWTGARVLTFFRNPLLKGQPGRGYKHTVKHNESGRRIAVNNPDGPIYFDAPHLAHLDAKLFDQLNIALRRQNAKHKRPLVNGVDPRAGVSKKRTRFPGQFAYCHYCGRQCHWGANGISDNLMCSGARRYNCWNSVGFSGPLAVEKITAAICNELKRLDGFRDQFAEMVASAQSQATQCRTDELAKLQRDCDQLAREKANVMAAIRKHGNYSGLREELADIKSRELEQLQVRALFDQQHERPLVLPESPAALAEQLEVEFRKLVVGSPRFGVLMRRLVPSMSIYVVRRFDGGPPLPRAKVTLNLAGNFPDVNVVPGLQSLLCREVTLDLFRLRQVEEIRNEAARLAGQGLTHAQIADQLPCRPTKTAVTNALALNRGLLSRGLDDPYIVLQDPPLDFPKLRRHLNKRYRFESLEGYQRPEI
jgi:hypothetical protein